MWIYEDQNWPNFTWDNEALVSKLADVRYHQGRLLGNVERLGFELKNEANLITLTNDIVKSSAIEGEALNSKEVRSSVARRLRIDNGGVGISTSRNVEGVVEMTLDATQQFLSPLTKERLFDWHAALFPTGRSGMHWISVAVWRSIDVDPMQVTSWAYGGKEKIHFEAPNAKYIEKEMQTFLDWFNNKDDTDPVIKAGIAHLWFITIHPFEDGNGRIARAIFDMAAARADDTHERFYSLSSQIELSRSSYYKQLEWQQRGTPEITEWLIWSLDCFKQAILKAEDTLGNVLFKAKLWEKINQNPINERQSIIVNRMLEDDFKGYMNTSKYAKIAKCSNDTALRDIQGLRRRDVFVQNAGGGRNTSYRINKNQDENSSKKKQRPKLRM